MATFSEFISSLDPETKGKGFERFVKWFLRTDPEWSTQVDQVWLWDDYPDRWGPDCGIDLVFKHKNNEVWAVQAKCYSPEYSINKSDVDTFLSESNRSEIDKKLLIASTDQIGKNAKRVCDAQEKTVTYFFRSDFEKAEIEYPDDISELRTAKRKPPPSPRTYQSKAISAVEEHFKEADRGQLIMACGTGKTYTTLWIKERLSARLTLVLVPSLNLLSQTLRYWTFVSQTQLAVLCVCSDKTVGKPSKDEITCSVKDLSFPVTSDVAEIRSFLNSDGDKVIFSTYQSSPIIAESQGGDDAPKFDLVIADEAHRCTGEVGSVFTTVLDATQIKAKKRLFTTATPRTYSANLKRSAEARGVDVTGMDDEALFGKVFHSLTFAEAIKLKRLTNYQVVVIGVDKPMIAEWIENRELVKTQSGNPIDAESFAAQIGLIKAIKDYDLKRMISFHSRVKRARLFASGIHDAIDLIGSQHRPNGEIWADFVSGDMPTSTRNDSLKDLEELKKGDIGLLSNARCLSEGVDVPTLDGVAFIDPKGSQIDIVQAVGRAIRLSDNKSVGTIVLPVFIEDGDDAEKSIQNSNFKPVWDVLNALKAHDEVLSFELDQLRTAIGRKGGGWTTGGGIPRVMFDLPRTVDASFAESLTTRIVEKTSASWNFWFGLLQRFIENEGHARVTSEFRTDGQFWLGRWCSDQRVKYRNGSLTERRFQLLTELDGWEWDLLDVQRREVISRLEQFYKREGHCFVPSRLVEPDGYLLKNKVVGLRAAFRKGVLEKHWVDYLLNELDFVWDEGMFWWLAQYKALRRWARKNKSSSPPRGTRVAIRISKHKIEERDISLFRNICITSYRYWETEGPKAQSKRSIPPRRLTKRQIQAIKRIPYWSWDARDARWEKYFDALVRFIEREGNPNVPATNHREKAADGTDVNLSRWMAKQRVLYKNDKLNLKKVERLNSVGMDWSGKFAPKKKKATLDMEDFDERLQVLQKYVENYGHAVVKQQEVFEGQRIGGYVSRWRSSYMGVDGRQKLTVEQIQALESVHPTWLWSAADAREGLAQPYSQQLANQLLKERHDHEIHAAIQYGLYAGLRMYETRVFEVRQLHGVTCFWVPGRAGYQERFIPIYSRIEKVVQLAKSPASLGAMFRRLSPLKGEEINGKTLFFSLHLTFRGQLRDIGLDAEIINGLSGWNPRIEWTKENLNAAKAAIDKIDY